MSPDRYKKVILNADDLGFSPSVNEAVVSAAEYGTVRAASLMVTMPFADSALALVRQRCPDLEIGLHFSLTCGKAVAPMDSVPLLVDTQGCFYRGFFGLARLLFSKSREEAIRQIRCELDAQLELIESLRSRWPFRLNHLDSHQHVHVLPGIFEMLCDESRKRKRHLRIPKEYFGGMKRFFCRLPHWFPGGFLKREILSRSLPKHVSLSGTPIRYFGILDSGKIGHRAMNDIFSAIMNDKSAAEYFEINIHPSCLADGRSLPKNVERIVKSSERRFHSSPWREKEWKTLTNDRLFQMLELYRLELSGFPD